MQGRSQPQPQPRPLVHPVCCLARLHFATHRRTIQPMLRRWWCCAGVCFCCRCAEHGAPEPAVAVAAAGPCCCRRPASPQTWRTRRRGRGAWRSAGPHPLIMPSGPRGLIARHLLCGAAAASASGAHPAGSCAPPGAVAPAGGGGQRRGVPVPWPARRSHHAGAPRLVLIVVQECTLQSVCTLRVTDSNPAGWSMSPSVAQTWQ